MRPSPWGRNSAIKIALEWGNRPETAPDARGGPPPSQPGVRPNLGPSTGRSAAFRDFLLLLHSSRIAAVRWLKGRGRSAGADSGGSPAASGEPARLQTMPSPPSSPTLAKSARPSPTDGGEHIVVDDTFSSRCADRAPPRI